MITKTRIDWIDIAKGGSIALVIFYHASYILDFYDLSHYYYIQLNSFFRPVRMPLFFAVSGFFAKKAISLSWKELLGNKIILFAYLLFVWSTIRWFYYGYLIENITKPEEGHHLSQFITMWIEPSGHIWFIWALAIFFVAAKAASYFKPLYVIAFFTAISVITFAEYITFDFFAHRNVLWYFPFFLFGLYFNKDHLPALEKKLPVLGIASFIGFLFLYFWKDQFEGLSYGIIRFFVSFLGLFWSLYLAFIISKIIYLKDIFLYFGRNTLPIYLIQTMMISLICVILSSLLAPSIGVYIAVPICTLLAVALTIAMDQAIRFVKADKYLYALPPFLHFTEGRARIPFTTKQ